ncbi:MAG TPA: hypothetical protein VKR58_06230 [Aquella sp.]|nr:hypothetical protein [Aquella sp.]
MTTEAEFLEVITKGYLLRILQKCKVYVDREALTCPNAYITFDKQSQWVKDTLNLKQELDKILDGIKTTKDG